MIHLVIAVCRGDMNHIKECLSQYFLFLIIVLYSSSNTHAQENLNYFQVDGRYDYRTELLRLALSYSEQAPELISRPDIPVARATSLLRNGEITGIISTSTSHELEENLHAVKIPIMAGILGMRVLLIHRDDQLKFSNIRSFNELQSLVAGFGEHWEDLNILQENKLPVETAAKYPSLFDMLNAKRFDYFPRGINEIFGEYKRHEGRLLNIVIENSLAIYYPYPVYFFVAKKDKKLAEIIHYGLEQSLDDGQFKALFLRHHSELLAKLDFENRIIFNLTNSALPNDAYIENIDWWLEDESRIK
jgi:hypothetical protein